MRSTRKADHQRQQPRQLRSTEPGRLAGSDMPAVVAAVAVGRGKVMGWGWILRACRRRGRGEGLGKGCRIVDIRGVEGCDVQRRQLWRRGTGMLAVQVRRIAAQSLGIGVGPLEDHDREAYSSSGDFG